MVDAVGSHPVDARSRVDIRADDVLDEINAAEHAAGLHCPLGASRKRMNELLAATRLEAANSAKMLARRRRCVRVRQPIGHQSRSSTEVGRRLLHCRDSEPAPGTLSRRVVAEGALIGK